MTEVKGFARKPFRFPPGHRSSMVIERVEVGGAGNPTGAAKYCLHII